MMPNAQNGQKGEWAKSREHQKAQRESASQHLLHTLKESQRTKLADIADTGLAKGQAFSEASINEDLATSPRRAANTNRICKT